MREIDYACSITNKTVVGDYTYFLLSRIDNYAVIMRINSAQDEYLFRVILQSEDVDTIFDDAENQSYLRPDEMDSQVKKYVVVKVNQFLTSRNVADKW